jgi:predicted aspartyl protease
MSTLKILHPTHFTSVTQPARLDTGSDITLIPERVKNKLGLLPATEISLTEAKGRPTLTKGYYVGLTFEDLTFQNIKVITTDLDYALVGLDVLNSFKIYADGKNQSFTLEDP